MRRSAIVAASGAAAVLLVAGIAIALAWPEPRPPPSTVTVTVSSPGRGVLEMEREIAIPLEQALRSIEGVELRTTSTDGAATVAVEGAEDPIDAVRAEVAALLDEVVLPEDAEPLISRSTARFPPLWLVVRGEPRVASAAAESAAYRIEAGPAMLAQPCGETEVELEVALDPDRMAARAVTVAHIERALAAGLTSIPAGFVQAHGHELSIRSAGIANGDELAGVVIQAHAGMYVRIGDVAEVRERFAEPRCTAWRDGPVVAIAVRRWGLDEGSEQSIAEALEWSSAPIERFGEGARIEQGRILHAAGASRAERSLQVEELARDLRALAGVTDVLATVEDHATRVALARPTETATREELTALFEVVRRRPGLAYLPDESVLVRVSGTDLEQALEVAARLRDALRRDPEVLAAELLDTSAPELAVTIDRPRLADLGVALEDVTVTLDAMSARGVDGGRYVQGREERMIVLRLPRLERDPGPLSRVQVAGARGLVPLDALVELRAQSVPARLLRVGGVRAVELAVAGDPSDAGDLAEHLEEVVEAIELPPGYTVTVVPGPALVD